MTWVIVMEWLSKASDMSPHLRSEGGSDLRFARLYAETGQVYADKGKSQQAIEYFLKAIKLQEANPDNCDPGVRAISYILLAE